MPRQLSTTISRALNHIRCTLHASKLFPLCWFSRSAHSDVDAMNRELADFFGLEHAARITSAGQAFNSDPSAVNQETLNFLSAAGSMPGSTDINQYEDFSPLQTQGPMSNSTLSSYQAAHSQPSVIVQEAPPALQQLQQCTAQLQEQVQAMSRLVRQVSLEQQQQQPIYARYQHEAAVNEQQQQQQLLGAVPETPDPSTPSAVQPSRPFTSDDWQQQQQQQPLTSNLLIQRDSRSEPTAAAAMSSTPAAAAAEAGQQQLTHVDSSGRASMVDVSSKDSSSRVAVASCIIHLGPAAFELVKHNQVKKGDVLTLAQVAGIQGAKQTATLIPLCHNIFLSKVDVTLRLVDEQHAVVITTTVKTLGQTGVEMEALTAASVAALTVYDMCKAVSKDIVISDMRLDYKAGGKSGTWERDSGNSSSSRNE